MKQINLHHPSTISLCTKSKKNKRFNILPYSTPALEVCGKNSQSFRAKMIDKMFSDGLRLQVWNLVLGRRVHYILIDNSFINSIMLMFCLMQIESVYTYVVYVNDFIIIIIIIIINSNHISITFLFIFAHVSDQHYYNYAQNLEYEYVIADDVDNRIIYFTFNGFQSRDLFNEYPFQTYLPFVQTPIELLFFANTTEGSLMATPLGRIIQSYLEGSKERQLCIQHPPDCPEQWDEKSWKLNYFLFFLFCCSKVDGYALFRCIID